MFEHFIPWRGKRRSKTSRGAKPSGRSNRLRIGRSGIPVFELLEMRQMLSGNTYSPSASVADSSSTSDNNLRTAITQANADTGTVADTINLSAGTYTLSLGQLDITNTDHALIIQGQGSSGPNATIIDQTALDRVFEVSGARVIFKNVEITGGTAETDDTGSTSTQAEGGGLLDEGDVTLDNVAVIGNKAVGQGTAGQNAVGGGVFSSGVLDIGDGSVIENNSAIAAAGVLANPTNGAFLSMAEGGGVFSNTESSLEISDTTIEGNIAQAGAGSESAPGGSTFGGGVYIFNATGAATSQLTDDTISGNQAIAGAGGAGGPGSNGGQGGFAVGGGVEIDFETANESSTGSAMGGPASIINSTISGNTVQGGAGGAAGSSGTVGDGGGGLGGGVDCTAADSEVLNDTIDGNSALGGNGETTGSGYGGGLDDETSLDTTASGMLVVSATFSANTAQPGTAPAGGTTGSGYGGGINNYGGDTLLQVQNTISAANTASTGPDVYGGVVNTDDNVIGDGTDSSGFTTTNGDQVGTSGSPLAANLGPLQNNGGNVNTVALLTGSPALGKGDPGVDISNNITTDERGLSRVVAGKMDVGAFQTQLQTPTVTNATTAAGTQTTSGLVITPAASDASVVTSFQITNITGGTLYQHNGTTPISDGDFISVAQGAAGLKFTPTGSTAGGSFTVQESTSASSLGLGGTTATATISVTAHSPSVTGTATTENTQTSSGLVITPNAADTSVTFFQITGISGGTLYQNNGTSQITNGDFITTAQAAAGLKFSPTTNSLAVGSFAVQESTSNSAGGLIGTTTTATIPVSFNGPAVTGGTTTEGTQTTSGLVVTPGALDTATNFQVTGITGGTLYQNDGTTVISNGSFITLAQGAAGLKFTPTTGSVANGSFTVRESSDGTTTGLSGPTATAGITVAFNGPSVTSAATTENTQTTSGLVITPGTNDTPTSFQITGISGGTLYQNDGTTVISNGAFITTAQGAAGLKFTPTTGSVAAGLFTVRESSDGTVAGLSGPTAVATITLSNVAATAPTVTPAATTENTQTTSGLVLTPSSGVTTYFQITNITGGTLYQNDGTTQITSGSFITLAQGEAGLKFTPTTGSTATGSFEAQEATGNSAGDLTGSTGTGTIFVSATASATMPTVTPAATTENTQTTSGLVITPSSGATTNFQITNITGGTLYQNDGTTQITSGSFITLAQGEAGLKFTPTSGSLTTGSFDVQEATGSSAGDLTGTTAAATIFVTSSTSNAPTVTPATTAENTQTTSGLVIGTSSSSVTYFQITGITGGTLYQNDGATQITNGQFITLAQGQAGVKFTPTTGSTANGTFNVQQATGNSAGDLIGSTAAATITVGGGATVTGATTTQNTQTTSGLVITPSSGSITDFEITGITGGTLYQNDGATQITNGSFITVAQGAAGLKFTPTTGSVANGSFVVQQSTSSSSDGLTGPTVTATISVSGTQAVDLSTYYNVTGITTDGTNFGTGIDGEGDALSETEVGTSITWNGITFALGSPNVPDVIQGTGQTITLSSGSYASVQLLAVGTNGNQPSQQFVVNYSDGTSTTVTQSISDWAMPQGYPGESVALTTLYRNTSNGGMQSGTFDVYGYSIAVDPSKTVESITLPDNAKVKVLSIATVAAVDAPSNLTATDASATQVNLSWTASDSTVTGYDVYRSTTSGAETTTPINSSPLSPTATSYQDTSVLAGNTYYYTVKAVNGTATSSASNEATVTVTSAAATTEVDLAGLYNLTGITDDGSTFGSGFDGDGNALSETQVGTSRAWNGVTFSIAPAGGNNVIQATGQTLDLPSGSYSQVDLLAAGVNGNQPSQTFTVNYTDGTSTTITQSISDWHMPQAYSGESIVLSSPYRNTSVGGRDNAGPFDVYGYSFAVDSAKTVASITLPDNTNVEVLSISMVAGVAAPTDLTATAESTTEVNLSWTAASGTVTGYNVYRGTTAGGESTTPLNSSPLAATATSYSDTTAVAGNTYFYVVKAVNTPAVSAASNEATATALISDDTAAQVDLSGEYNLTGITANGTTFAGGLDGNGNALSATLLGTTQTWNGATFDIGAAGSSNVVQATGQTVGLPNGEYSQVELLATGVNGNQPPQTFTVNYTDGTSTAFARSISDWATPQNNAGEATAVTMAYRNTSSGGQFNSTFNVYGYTLAVDNTKTIASITLPDNKNVEILAITAAP